MTPSSLTESSLLALMRSLDDEVLRHEATCDAKEHGIACLECRRLDCAGLGIARMLLRARGMETVG